MGAEPLLIERLTHYCAQNPLLSVTPSREPLYREGLDALVIPAPRLLDRAFPRKEAIHRLGALDCSLVAHGAAELLPACFLAGCDEYLRRPWSPEELEWRIRRLRSDRQPLFRMTWGRFAIESLEVKAPAASSALSIQEGTILRLLAVNAGKPVTREALYYGIWGRPPEGASRAVDVHVASLRRKLRSLFPESGQCIRSVRGVGYLMKR